MNRSEAVGWGQRTLAKHNIESAALDARLLFCHVTHLSREDLIRAPDQAIADAELQQYKTLIQRREKREPVAYLIGHREFWGLDLECEQGVLIPRPDSETLIELALERYPDKRRKMKILDLGTGTGALLLALLHEFPRAIGVGTDIAPVAIALAQRNAARLGLADRAEFIETNWITGLEGVFDLVISNPPYISQPDIAGLQADVRDFEPHLALEAGTDGLNAYREISTVIGDALGSEGSVVLEIGEGQEFAVRQLFTHAGFIYTGEAKDLSGIVRALTFEKD